MAPESNQRELRCGPLTRTGDKSSSRIFEERHYTVDEIANMWNLSKDAVRRLFAKEAGVVVFGRTEGRAHKRPYTTLRIPECVVERVHRSCSLVMDS